MTDANTICHDVDLLGDWLDAKGFTEEAGLCLRVLGLIHEQAEENEKTKRFYIEAGFELRQLREDNKRLQWELGKALDTLVAHDAVCAENERLRERLEKAHSFISRADWMQFFEEEHAAAAALKEMNDDNN